MAADRATANQTVGLPKPEWDWEVFESTVTVASGNFRGALAALRRMIHLKYGKIPIEVS